LRENRGRAACRRCRASSTVLYVVKWKAKLAPTRFLRLEFEFELSKLFHALCIATTNCENIFRGCNFDEKLGKKPPRWSFLAKFWLPTTTYHTNLTMLWAD